MSARGITQILNVTDLEESFRWFEAFGWAKLWDWGDPPGFGAVGSGPVEIFLCQGGQGGRSRLPDGQRSTDSEEAEGNRGVWMSLWVADVDAVQFISAADALAEFRELSGFGAALDQLPDNPLPHTLVVRPSAGNTSASMLLLQEELGNLPEAEYVQVDTEWVQRFHAILDIVRQAIAIGGALLGIAIVVIIGNTIRLDIENRRDEIEVTKLIGASNAFVRRPFLWTGFWYGLFGGLFALALVFYGLYLLEGPVARLAGLYQSNIAIASMGAAEAAGIVGIGVALGLLGSWFTAARHMRRIEPR